MKFEEFEKALETLHIVSSMSSSDIKMKYIKLSKEYHPDMKDGDDKKFKEINEAYKLILTYIKKFRYKLNKEEFYQQNPFSNRPDDWYKSFNS